VTKRSFSLALLGLFPLLAGAIAACGGAEQQMQASSTTGSGGTGGGSSTTTTTTDSTGGSGGTGGTLDNGMPSDSYPAPHPAPPHVQSYGGPVLTSPKIVPVVFDGDDPTIVGQIADFSSKVGATQYWAANTMEYGVGPATATAPVDLSAVPESAPAMIDDAAIQTWLGGKLNGDDPLFPAADGNTVYAIYYPAGTTITLQGSTSCNAFGGYHSNFALDAAHGSQQVAYAVIPRCDNFDGMVGIDAVTATASHELLEAATDPFPMTTPAYTLMDDAHIYWLRILGGGETGDMCAQFSGSFTTFAELPYLVQRSWSNKSANAGHDPCVPAIPGDVYFNAAPVLNEWVTYSLYGQNVQVKGVTIPLGESKTIDLDLFSDGDTGGPFTVDVQDTSALFGGTPHLDLSLDRASGQNGEKLHLTITVNTAGKHNTETFAVISQLGSTKHAWFGIVGQ